jgi:hypothetical protein
MISSLMRETPDRQSSAGGLMRMSGELAVRRLPIRLQGDDRRVILRPFVMSHGRVRTLFERLAAMSEQDVATLLAEVTARSLKLSYKPLGAEVSVVRELKC